MMRSRVLAVMAALLVGVLGGAVIHPNQAFAAGASSTLIVPLDGTPVGVAVDTAAHRAYVIGTDFLTAVDAITGEVVKTVYLSGVVNGGIAVDPATHTVYVSDDEDAIVLVIDGSSLSVTATVTVGANPAGMAVDPLRQLLYVANTNRYGESNDTSVSVIDTATNTVTATTNLPPAEVWDVAVDPSTHQAFVAVLDAANHGDGVVDVLDPDTYQLVQQITVGPNPRAVDVDATLHTVYAVNYDELANSQDGPPQTMSVINGSTKAVTGTVTVGHQPLDVAVDPVGHLVYVANSDASVSVYDETSRTVLHTLDITDAPGNTPRPFGIATDPGLGRVFVAAGYFGSTTGNELFIFGTPAPPTGLTAQASGAGIRLDWTPSATDGGSPVTGYTILRSTTAGDQAAQSIAQHVASGNYVDEDVTPGSTYYYRVRAENGYGTSPDSAEVSATIDVAGEVPGPPTGLDAQAGDHKVALTWDPPGGDAAITGYEVLRSTRPGAESATPLASGVTEPEYTDTAVDNGGTYFYEVRAVGASGTSAPSAEVKAVPSAAASGPSSTVTSCLVDDLQQAVAAGGTVTLTCPNAIGFTAPIVISKSVTLVADGAVTLDGQQQTPLFSVKPGATLTLSGLTVQNGLAGGDDGGDAPDGGDGTKGADGAQ